MNVKRGILIGIALYATVFILGIIINIISRTTLQSPEEMPTTYWVITIISTVLLTSLASLWYFNKAKRNVIEGVKLGGTFVLVGFVIDLLLFIPLMFSKEGWQMIGQYYSSISFYITLALVVASAIFVGSRVSSLKEEVKTKKRR